MRVRVRRLAPDGHARAEELDPDVDVAAHPQRSYGEVRMSGDVAVPGAARVARMTAGDAVSRSPRMHEADIDKPISGVN